MIVASPMFRKLLLRSLVVILVAVVALDILLTRYTAYHETRNAERQLQAQARILADEVAGLPADGTGDLDQRGEPKGAVPRHPHRARGRRARRFRSAMPERWRTTRGVLKSARPCKAGQARRSGAALPWTTTCCTWLCP